MSDTIGARPRGRWNRRGWLLALFVPALLWPIVVERTGPSDPLPVDAPATSFSGYRARAELESLLDGVGPHPTGTAGAALVRGRIVDRLAELGLEPHIQDTWVASNSGWATRVRNVWASLPATAVPAATTTAATTTTTTTAATADTAAGVSAATAREASGAGRDTILLLCHYDSVGAGPGAGDDGSGVACLLEVARAMRAAQTPRARELLFFFDEGEEDGLLGAHAFLAEHPAASSVGLVINLEARGTDGPSVMFETSRDNGGLVDLYARQVPRPFATSLTGEAYRRMPNSTDMRLFLDRGYPGYNFAFIGGGRRYHTDRDDLAHLSTATLQHQGESVLALANGLLALPELASITGAEGREQSPVVYTSIMGSFILAWPESSAPYLALLALLPIVFILRRAGRQGVFRWRQLLLAAPVGLFIFVLPLLVGFGLYRALLLLTGLPIIASAHEMLGSGVPRILFLTAAMLPLLAWGPFLARLARPLALWATLALSLALCALVSGIFLPAISHMCFLPACALAASGLFMGTRREDGSNGQSIAVIGAVGVLPVVAMLSVLWIPTSLALEEALGFVGGLAWTVPAALVSLAVAPLMAQARSGALAAARFSASLLAALAFLAAVRLPHFSADNPAPLNLACQHDGEQAHWLIRDYGLEPAAPLQRAAGLGPDEVWPTGGSFPWRLGKEASWSPSLPRLELLSEEMLDLGSASGTTPLADEVTAGATPQRRIRLLATPGTGGDVTDLRLVLEGETPLLAITVAGVEIPVNRPGRRRRNGGQQVYGIRGNGAEAVEVELLLEGSGEVSIGLAERILGLPPAGAALLKARALDRAPIQGGDRSIAVVNVTI